jgi:hypothetical protein
MFKLAGVGAIGCLLAACAPPPSPRLPTTARPTGHHASPQIDSDARAVVSPGAPAPEPAPGRDPDAMRDTDATDPERGPVEQTEPIEQTEITGPGGIHVVVRRRTETGTWHIAEELVIRTPGGVLRFTAPAIDGTDDVTVEYPLVEQILAAGPSRWVVLGWSSLGEGMQTELAWLIEERRGPQILDTLAWTTDRGHAGVAVESSGNLVRIGIPLPQPRDNDGKPDLHNAGGWELVHGKQRLSLEEVERLQGSEENVMSLRGYYDPPFQVEPSRRRWSGRFLWFSSGATFTLEHRR